MKSRLLSADKALLSLLEGKPIAEETGEYIFTYDGQLISMYHCVDKRCFLATKTPKHKFTLYEGVKYYITDYSFLSKL